MTLSRPSFARLLSLCLLLLCLMGGLLSSALAQDCQELNFIAVNDIVLDAARPCYFIGHGDSTNAFVRANALAAALDARVKLEDQRLVFERQDRVVSLAVTADIRSGLQVQPGALVVDGKSGNGLLGIASSGQHYVAVGPVAQALGASTEWDGAHRIIFIDLPRAAPSPASQPEPATAASDAPTASPPAAGSKRMDGAPRVGPHHDSGFTRVVLDLPVGVRYRVEVGQTQLLITLEDVAAETYANRNDDPFLRSLQLYPVDGGMALRIEAGHRVSAAGQGFKLSLLPADGGNARERLVVDLGPELRAENLPVSAMADATPQERVQEMAAAVQRPRSNGYTVVIDPGHGGHDPGATGQAAGWNEKQVVLAISLKLRDILRERGVEVIMTRDGDGYLPLGDRAGMATNDRNVFVSVHANGAENRKANGIETFVFGVPLDNATLQQAIRENAGAEGREAGERRTQEALEVANSIAGNIFRQEQLISSKALAAIVQRKMVGATGWIDRGVKENAFAVLRTARTPAILVEVGFMTNPEEGRRLATEAYQTKLAQAIAEGVLEFLDQGGQLSARK